MFTITKHLSSHASTIIFSSPSESLSRARFAKSARLLKKDECLELSHDNVIIDSCNGPKYGPLSEDQTTSIAHTQV